MIELKEKPIIIGRVRAGDVFDGVIPGLYQVRIERDQNGKWAFIEPLIVGDKDD